MKQSIVILTATIVVAAGAYSQNTALKGLGFTAPTLNGRANVLGPQRGEIIYDTSDNTFYGNLDASTTGWVPLSSPVTSGLNARYTTNTLTLLPINITTLVRYEDKSFDSDNAVDISGGSWKFTAPTNGIYQVSAALSVIGDYDAGDQLTLTLYKNGTTQAILAYTEDLGTLSNARYMLTGSDLVKLSAGDTIDIRIAANTSSAASIEGNESFNYVSVERISIN